LIRKLKNEAMTHFFFRFFLLTIVVCFFACRNTSNKKIGSTDTILPASNRQIDSISEISVNVSGDSISFLNWSSENEMLGLGRKAFGDLDSMIARRYIRVLVPYSKTYYYIEGMKRYGASYDLLNLFEQELNTQLKLYPAKVNIIFIPVTRKQFIPLLTEGYADMAVGGYTITPERKKLVDFSEPTITGLKEIVVGGPSSPNIHSLTDLAGQHIFIHEHSSYQASLQRLNSSLQRAGLKPLHIEFIDPYLEVEDILEMVNAGIIPFTITAEDIGTLWKTVFENLKVYTHLAVDSNVSYGCAFRKNSPKLKSVADRFISHTGKGTLTGNIIYGKYLKDKGRLRNINSRQALEDMDNCKLSFIKYGKEYDLDWRLLAAQGYQESQFNNQTVSSAGAVGIMQLLPSTAAGNPIYIPNVKSVDDNIHAGVKYMHYIIEHYYSQEQMDDLNKHLFALATYNAGPTWIRRLRNEARSIGLNENEWFNNVEILAAKHIGVETVQYVSNIYKYYRAFHGLKRFGVSKGIKTS
jgi:membrane-bound lytic murein transglycosylase MltF